MAKAQQFSRGATQETRRREGCVGDGDGGRCHERGASRARAEGKLLVVGAAQSMQVSPLLMIMGMQDIKGWYSGTLIDSQDTLAFSVMTGVRSMNEVFTLDRVMEGYDRMMSGKARFRAVLKMG